MGKNCTVMANGDGSTPPAGTRKYRAVSLTCLTIHFLAAGKRNILHDCFVPPIYL
jgi:hypothetical protein